jgi:hypothetical protein
MHPAIAPTRTYRTLHIQPAIFARPTYAKAATTSATGVASLYFCLRPLLLLLLFVRLLLLHLLPPLRFSPLSSLMYLGMLLARE